MINKSRHRTMHFTLIELLVVVAIISTLAAMALSSVTAVKKRAKSCWCINNLRQLGLAAQIYSQQFKGVLPHEDAGTSIPPSGSAWYDVLTPFIECSDPEKIKQCPAVKAEPSWHTFKMNSLLETEATPFYKLGSTRRESSTVLFFDGRIDNGIIRYQIKGTYNSATARHDEKTNLLLLDGHTDSHRPQGVSIGGWDGPGPYVWDPDE